MIPVRSKGFTLVELVIAIVIAGFVISGVVVTSAQLVSRTADPMFAVQRIHIAESYLDEISAQKFSVDNACAAPASGLRRDFSEMCQYRVLNNSPVQDQFGSVPTGLDDYRVSVDVSGQGTGDSKLGPAGARTTVNATALVRVTVTSPDGSTTVLSGYFVNGA